MYGLFTIDPDTCEALYRGHGNTKEEAVDSFESSDACARFWKGYGYWNFEAMHHISTHKGMLNIMPILPEMVDLPVHSFVFSLGRIEVKYFNRHQLTARLTDIESTIQQVKDFRKDEEQKKAEAQQVLDDAHEALAECYEHWINDGMCEGEYMQYHHGDPFLLMSKATYEKVEKARAALDRDPYVEEAVYIDMQCTEYAIDDLLPSLRYYCCPELTKAMSLQADLFKMMGRE